MVNVNKLVKPAKMLNKIRNTVKRTYELYNKENSFWSRADSKAGLRPVDPKHLPECFKRITTHLWYDGCGMSEKELCELIAQEYQAMKVEELLDAS